MDGGTATLARFSEALSSPFPAPFARSLGHMMFFSPISPVAIFTYRAYYLTQARRPNFFQKQKSKEDPAPTATKGK